MASSVITETAEKFEGGVIQTVGRAEMPDNAYYDGRNVAFGQTVPLMMRVRPGTVKWFDGFGASEPLLALIDADLVSSLDGQVYHYYFGLTATSKLARLGSTSAMGDGDARLLGGSGATIPQTMTSSVRMIVARNCIVYTTGAGAAYAFDNTTGTLGLPLPLRPLGNTAPAAAPYGEAVAGPGPVTAGTYEFRWTYYDPATGDETSPGPTVSITVPTTAVHIRIWFNVGAGYTNWKTNLYVRKTSIQSKFWRAMSLDYAGGGGSWVYFTLTNDQLNALVIECPAEHANDPPPQGLRDLAWHNTRLFATDGDKLYYSQLDSLHRFDASSYELVGRGDGQRITALLSYDANTLIIFKSASIWVMEGTTPQEWVIRRLTHEVGCLNTSTIAVSEGRVYFWGRSGPYVLVPGEGPPQSLATQFITKWLDEGQIVYEPTARITAAADPRGKRVIWVLTAGTGRGINWSILSYSTALNVWESEGWDVRGALAAGNFRGIASLQDRLVVSIGPTGEVVYFNADTITDQAANYTGENLVYPIVSFTDVNNFTIAHTATFPVRTDTANSLARVCVPNGGVSTSIHHSTYTRSAGSTIDTITLGTALPSVPVSPNDDPIGAFVTFDMPVALLSTKRWDGGFRSALKRYLWAHLDGELRSGTPAAHRIQNLSLFLDDASNPARSWTTTTSIQRSSPLRKRIARTGQLMGARILWTADFEMARFTLRSERRHDRT